MRLVVAIAPEFTIGFVVCCGLSSIAITELNGRPVLLTPSRRRASSAPIASSTRANTNAFEMLWIVNGQRASPTECTFPLAATTDRPNRSGLTEANAGM